MINLEEDAQDFGELSRTDEGLRIEHLADHVDAIPTLASWILEEWGYSFADGTFEELISEFERRTIPHTIPETFVALEGDRCVGTASIVARDMSIRPELSPWLAAVYVVPECRSKGIGTKLARSAMLEAETLGLDKLYLFTPDRRDFYGSLGWHVCEHVAYRGVGVVIMQYQVRGSSLSVGRGHRWNR